MPQDSKAVANYFLDLAKRDHKGLTPMKLQKLVYFANGWNLAVHGEPLISDKIEAWRYGPVIPSLYHEFKDFGSHAITRKAVEWNFADGQPELLEAQLNGNVDTEIINTVWESYKDLTAAQLSNVTHEPGSPWDKTWSEGLSRKNVDISNQLIREHFVDLMNAPAS